MSSGTPPDGSGVAHSAGAVPIPEPEATPNTSAMPSLSADFFTMLRFFEGCCLTAYQDQGGTWTIGYGHTGPEVVQGMVWTPEQAAMFFAKDVATRQFSVWGLCLERDFKPSQAQLSALVSLGYNIGINALASSTVMRLIGENDIPGAAEAFLMWNKVQGKFDDGLLRRRVAEHLMFLEDNWNLPGFV